MAEIRRLENRHDAIFFCRGDPIWIKLCRLVPNNMLIAVIWSKLKPEVEFQYGGRLGKFSGMSSQIYMSHCRHCHLDSWLSWFQSHMPHCRVLPCGEFGVMIPVQHATLQGAVTRRNQCHDRATLQGVRIPSAILKIGFRHILFIIFCFLNVVWALASGGSCIVSDTLA